MWLARITATADAIRSPSAQVRAAALARQATLTKPPGSLGRLEELSAWLASVQGQERPDIQRPVVLLIAADHGVARRGVSAYPSEVTAQMVANFLAGGAAVNVLAREVGASVVVVDAGVAAPLPQSPTLLNRSHGPGTVDMTVGSAMARDVALACIADGIALAEAAIDEGADLILLGEMGIGNTTAAAAITSVYTGLPVRHVTGRGTGLDDAGFEAKVNLLEVALTLHAPDPADPVGALAAVGGFEIAMLAGVVVGSAARRVPVVLDGFITTAAALVADALAPELRGWLLAAHQSVERGHAAALHHLGLTPLLNLDLRLGEGTGALLAVPLLRAAARLLNEMATFSEAGVSQADAPPVTTE